MMKNNLKYPIYFFLAIFIAKFGYVIVESFYNYYVLITTTKAEVTQETLKNLNENGHLISAFGLTILLIPLFYYFVKKQNNKKIYIILSSASIIVFIVMYNLLNIAVDTIVESNKDKRYDAFYISLLKIGMLNNKFSYNSFIDNKKIANNSLDVNDRILLTNSFLLLYADQKLIDKLRLRGKETVADMYIEKYLRNDYDAKYKDFKTATQKIAIIWKEFNSAREKLNIKIKDAENVKKKYKIFLKKLRQSYSDYKNGYDALNDKIAKETSQDKLEYIRKKLLQYFRYQNYDKAKRKYKDAMYNNFGYYIEPSRWKDSNGYITYKQIKKVIAQEIKKKTPSKLLELPQGLSQKEFVHNLDIKIKVAKELKKDGILIPIDFDYSYTQFKKYYSISVNKKINNASIVFYKELKKKIGKNDLKLDMDWDGFVNSNYIRNKIKSKLNIEYDKDIDIIIEAIKSKDLANFKKMLYLPKIIKKIEDEYEYSKEDFLDGNKAAQKGDEAIKLLYIPPFALAVSILALLLNIITVFGLALEATKKVPKKAIFALQIIFIATIISIPILSNYDGFDNKFIKKVSNSQIKTYLQFLNWISYYESINYNIHKKF